MDQIADESQERWFDKLALNEAIGGLTERERLIVYLRYYRDQTQSEVASRLGISQVQVSRLEKKYCRAYGTRSRSSGSRRYSKELLKLTPPLGTASFHFQQPPC